MKGYQWAGAAFFCLTILFSENCISNTTTVLMQEPFHFGNNLMYQVPFCQSLPKQKIRNGITLTPNFQRYTKNQKPAIQGLLTHSYLEK